MKRTLTLLMGVLIAITCIASLTAQTTQVSMAQFMDHLYTSNETTYARLIIKDYESFLAQANAPHTPAIFDVYARINFYHMLLTSTGASNNARGGILDIPYMWHWVTPNPRHGISFAGSLITNIEYSGYNSYADADRTPELFLGDLINSIPFIHPEYGEFYTFGWCSEREMAYSAIMQYLGYNTLVVAPGAHAWSEVLISYADKEGYPQTMIAEVDNTYNSIHYRDGEYSDITYDNLDLQNWYNKSVKRSLPVLKKLRVPALAQYRMSTQVTTMLNAYTLLFR